MAAAGVLHWFTRVHLMLWFTGQRRKRVKWIEYNLPRMVAKRLLRESRHKGRKVYTAWSNPMHVEHGVVCSEALIRFVQANSNCTLISENACRTEKFGVVFEWAALYPNRTMLLFEYCTEDNAGRSGLVTRKVNLYRRHLDAIEAHFSAQALVLFVLDGKDALAHATENQGASFAYFVDLETFMSMKMGKQLTAPIYIWGADGRRYPIKDV